MNKHAFKTYIFNLIGR